MPYTHAEAYCPFCNRVVIQRILIVDYYETKEPTGWEGHHCFLCGQTTVWKDGKLVMPDLSDGGEESVA
jgi:hypothetical protein